MLEEKLKTSHIPSVTKIIGNNEETAENVTETKIDTSLLRSQWLKRKLVSVNR